MRLLPLLVLPFLAAACDSGPGYARPDVLLYVTNQNGASVTVFNATRARVETTLDLVALGFSPQCKPHFALVEPGGRAWYVSLIGDGKVVKLSRDNRVLGSVAVETPGMMVLDPASNLLAVGRSMTAVNPPASVVFIDRVAMTEVDRRNVAFPRPHGLAFAMGHVFTASLSQNRLAALPAAGGEAVFSGTGGTAAPSLGHLAVAPGGGLLVVTGEPGGRLYFLQPHADGTLTLLGEMEAGTLPWHPQFSPDGRLLAVPLKGDDAVLLVDVPTRTALARIRGDGLAEPHGSAFSPDGRTLYVTGNNTRGTFPVHTPGDGTLVVIDVAARRVRQAVEVGAYPTGLGHAPHAM